MVLGQQQGQLEERVRLGRSVPGAFRRATGLSLNEIGRVRLRTHAPVFYDEYRRNRVTGSFILIDETTNVTVGAGMILGEAS